MLMDFRTLPAFGWLSLRVGEESHMNNSEFCTNWKLLRPQVRRQWPELSHQELDRIDGRPHRLYHALVQRYGISRDEAARQMWDFLERSRKDVKTVQSN